ncbi:MAG: nucleotidyl transferase AbiEii/AbiGii toxin family protein [candidate division KSB1 bacterium]|nr:nucleotidyl transferase AbiEii/AbiGii toxin family protein [candidate division KSB1 bacterium]
MNNQSLSVNPLFKAALELQYFFQLKNWNYCFIGGLAVIRWGEMRMTQDIDICLMCGFGAEEVYVRALLREFRSRLTNAHQFAVQNRVLLLYASNGVSIDISLSGLPFEENMIERASYFEFLPEYSLLTCSAEDLIVLKAFADRDKDWVDIEGIISRNKTDINYHYIIEQLTPLCQAKEAPAILERLNRLFGE